MSQPITLDLKACPFCKYPHVRAQHHPSGIPSGSITYVICDNCGAVCSFVENGKPHQTERAWNRRAEGGGGEH